MPMYLPYPQAHPGNNMQRRVGAAERVPPMLPAPPPGAGPAEWQPMMGMGAGWAMAPFLPLLPPPFQPRNGGGRPGNPANASPVSRERFLDRERAMLIAHADMAMGRAAAAQPAGQPPAGQPPGAVAQGVNRAALGHPAALEDLSVRRERIGMPLINLGGGIKERRRARRDARDELEDLMMGDEWPLPGGFPYRSRRPQALPKAPAANMAADGSRAGSGKEVKEVRQPSQRPEWELLGAPHERDPNDPEESPAALRLRLDPSYRARAVEAYPQGGSVRRRRQIVVEPADDRGKQQEEYIDVDGEEEKAMGVWGWGIADRWWESAAGKRSYVGQPVERLRKRRSGDAFAKSNGNGKVAAEGDRDGAKHGEGSLEQGSPREDSDESKRVRVAPPAHAFPARFLHDRNGGNVAGKMSSDVFPWPSRAIAPGSSRDKKANVGEPEDSGGGVSSAARKSEDDEVVVLEDQPRRDSAPDAHAPPVRMPAVIRGAGNEAPPPPPPQAAAVSNILAVERAIKTALEESSNGSLPVDAWGEEGQPIDYHEEVPEDEVGAAAVDHSRPKPSQKVHHRARFKRAKKRNDFVRDSWLAFDGDEPGGAAPAYFGQNEEEEKEAAGAVANAVMAAAKLAVSEEPGSGLQGVLSQVSSPRRDKIEVAAEGMLRLHVAPAAREENGRAAGVVAPVDPSNGAPPQALNGAAVDGAKEPSAGGAAAAGAAAVPPAPAQPKEDRSEMVTRALKKYSFYQVSRGAPPDDCRLQLRYGLLWHSLFSCCPCVAAPAFPTRRRCNTWQQIRGI